MQDTSDTKTITLKIHHQSFDITVKNDFVVFLAVSIHDDFGLISNISKKELLKAYVKANYELFKMKQ